MTRFGDIPIGSGVDVVALPISAQPVLDTGVSGQLRAGRSLLAADFTTLLGRAAPVGLFPLDGTTNLGSGAALVNKGAIAHVSGVSGVASSAAQFTGSTAQAFYLTDTGGTDPFRLKTGSWGCWMRTAKRSTLAYLLSKTGSASPDIYYTLRIETTNVAGCDCWMTDNTNAFVTGISDITDDRWHFVVATFDGTMVRLYVDGVLEGSNTIIGTLQQGSLPFNIGARSADAVTAAAAPHYGRIDEAFVTPDVLSADEIRLLMCVKVAHGLAAAPTRTALSVRRRKKGGAIAPADFPSAPLRLYNFVAGAVTDQGSAGVGVSGSGAGTVLSVASPDGIRDGALHFAGATVGVFSTDAGLPAGLSSRSYGLWCKMHTSPVLTRVLMGWGTVNTADARLLVATGPPAYAIAYSGADFLQGLTVPVDDDRWHFIIVVEDNGAVDGLKRKMYVDGRLAGTSTGMNSLTLAGASRFRVGANPDGSVPHLGQLTRAFVYAGALTAEQVAVLYAVGSLAIPASEGDAAEHVEAVDATNAYMLFDGFESQDLVDLRVAL